MESRSLTKPPARHQRRLHRINTNIKHGTRRSGPVAARAGPCTPVASCSRSIPPACCLAKSSKRGAELPEITGIFDSTSSQRARPNRTPAAPATRRAPHCVCAPVPPSPQGPPPPDDGDAQPWPLLRPVCLVQDQQCKHHGPGGRGTRQHRCRCLSARSAGPAASRATAAAAAALVPRARCPVVKWQRRAQDQGALRRWSRAFRAAVLGWGGDTHACKLLIAHPSTILSPPPPRA